MSRKRTIHKRLHFFVRLFKWIFSIASILQYVSISLLCQNHHVQLNSSTTEDRPTDHIVVFTKTPIKEVKLPKLNDTSQVFFTNVFYSWNITRHPDVILMFIQKEKGEEIYIDKNNNNDLTDDGSAFFFSSDSNSFDFIVNGTGDKNQEVKLRFYRKPIGWNYPDSVNSIFFDHTGNLKPNFAQYWGSSTGLTNFSGRKGEFYWDDRVNVRRGSLLIDGTSYSIGLFDFNNNGLYNDSVDAILLDEHGDGILSFTKRAFKLNDVFSLANRNFKIHDLNKYGEWIELEETFQSPTFYYFRGQDSTFDPIVWNIKGASLNGQTISLKRYKGKYLLLNFWGEWCKPCIQEIPALVKARKKYTRSKIEFVSFVKVSNIDKAKRSIADFGIKWPQLYLPDDIEKMFSIRGYPTNVLIFPNGRDCAITNSVNESFFDKFIQ